MAIDFDHSQDLITSTIGTLTAANNIQLNGGAGQGSLQINSLHPYSMNVNGNLFFGSNVGAKLQLFSGQYGIGITSSELTNWAAAGGYWGLRNNSYTGTLYYIIGATTITALTTSGFSPCGLGYIGTGPIFFGAGANTRGVGSRIIVANGTFANSGDAQFADSLVRIQTAAGQQANTVNLSTTGANTTANIYGSMNQIALGNNSVYYFKARVAARDSNNNAKLWTIEGGIKCTVGPVNTTPFANTTFVGAPTITVVASDAAATLWNVAAAIDGANNALIFRANGSSNTTNWVARVETTEVA